MKLIDKDALVAEIERRLYFDNNWIEGDKRWQKRTDGISSAYYKRVGSKHACENILDFINTLEVKEVDFEKELDRIWFDNKLGNYFDNDALDFAHIRTLCRHFFELGLSVSNSTKVNIPDIDDVLKENGVNPDSKEAKIIKESYFMAIEKLTQKGEEV